MRTPSAKANSEEGLKSLITVTTKLWRSHHLTYDQARYVAKEVRRALSLERPKQRKRVVARQTPPRPPLHPCALKLTFSEVECPRISSTDLNGLTCKTPHRRRLRRAHREEQGPA
jgi:hypothetical protein